MKRVISIAAMLVLSCSLFACSPTSSSVSLDQSVGIDRLNCSVPANWSKGYGSVETAKYAPADKDQETFVLLFYSIDGMELIGNLEELESWIKAQNEAAEIRSIESLEISGYPARKIHYQYPSEDGSQNDCTSVMIDAGGDLGALSLACPSKDYADNEELFNAILGSVSITEA